MLGTQVNAERMTINVRLVELENSLEELSGLVNFICTNIFGSMPEPSMPTKGIPENPQPLGLAMRIAHNTNMCRHNINKLIEITEELM